MNRIVKSSNALGHLVAEGHRRRRGNSVTGAMVGAGIAAILAPVGAVALLAGVGAAVGAALGSRAD